MPFTASVIFKGVDMFTAPARAMESSAGKLGRKFKSMGGEMLAMGAGVVSVSTILFTAGKAITDFDEGITSLKAITGLTGDAFIPFKNEIYAIGKATNKSYVDVAKTMELLASLDATLLNNAKSMSAMTEASVLLAKASGMDLTESATSLAAIMQIYGANASESAKYVDILSTSEQKGTYTVAQLADGLKTVGGTARVLGMDIDQTSALLQAMAPSSKSVEVASTGLNSILNKLGVSTKKEFNPAIVGAKKAIDNMAKANLSLKDAQDLVGRERAGQLLSLINQNKVVQELTGNQHDVGNAQKQAAERSKAFNIRIQELTNRFKNLVITGSEGSGALNAFGRVIGFITDNLGTILGVIGLVAAYYLTSKLLLFGMTAATWLYNTALDVQILLSGKSLLFLQKGGLIMKLFTGYQKAAAAAQWLFNTSLLGCPIIWIIVGVMALVAGIILLVRYWDDVKKAVDDFSNTAVGAILGIIFPFTRILELISFVQDRWQGLKKAFEGGFGNGLMAVGKMLLNFVLKPIETILSVIAKATGVDWAKDALGTISEFRKGLDNGLIDESKVVNKDATLTEKQYSEKKTTQNVQIDINDLTGRAKVGGQLQPIPINVNSTRAFPWQ